MNLYGRRRAIAGENDNCPYIKNGLIFWLDGIKKGTDPSKWVDLIGGKVFDLTNCTFADNGVIFGSSSFGQYSSGIGTGWDIDTIECSASEMDNYETILYPGNDETHSYIGLVKGSNGNTGYRIDTENFQRVITANQIKTISINSIDCVYDGVTGGVGANDNWSNNNGGITTIGRRLSMSNIYQFSGTMHSIRIYNRHLSTSEMLHNQKVDNERFNLGLSI